MSDTPLPLPEGLRWIKIVCRLGRLAHDGVDPDDKPDLLPTAGKVRLASSPARLRVQEPDGRWRSVSLDDREYSVRTDGELVDTEGRVGVWIPDPASELLDPRPYMLVAHVIPAAGERWAARITGENLPDVVDLVAHSETVAIPASAVPGLSSRIAALEGILAGGGGGTGTSSGIRTVSGTVTLDATPGIYEVYALDAATVNGEPLAAGEAAIFRYLSGEWRVRVMNADGTVRDATWRAIGSTPTPDPDPDSPTVVVAPAPTADDSTDTITIPDQTGVEYLIGGVVRTGTYNVGNTTTSVTVTARAETGYQLSGDTSWTFSFTVATSYVTAVDYSPVASMPVDEAIYGTQLTAPDGTVVPYQESASYDVIHKGDGWLTGSGSASGHGTKGIQPSVTTAAGQKPQAVRISFEYQHQLEANANGLFQFYVGTWDYATEQQNNYRWELAMGNSGVSLQHKSTRAPHDGHTLTWVDGFTMPDQATVAIEMIGINATVTVNGVQVATGTAQHSGLRGQQGIVAIAGAGQYVRRVRNIKYEVMP